MKDFRVRSGQRFHLDRIDPSDTREFRGKKSKAVATIEELGRKLERLQDLLFADHRYALLIVLQGMDTAGKDGVIRHVFTGVNPQGVEVATFKEPTTGELDHDFLWRVHIHAPAKGRITIFNRSHYEDVLAVRVHKLVPKEVWERRYAAINEFERTLSNEGTRVLKFFLHIDRTEQKKRLQARLDDPTKRWKFNPNDLHERRFWSDYMEAYEDMVAKTNTDWAPWHVIPSDYKWFRNWGVSKVMVETLDGLKLAYPKGPDHPESIKIP